MSIEPISEANLKKTMDYVAGRRHGYMKELNRFSDEAVNSMKYAHFLKTGYTMDAETFGITDDFIRFYRTLYGDYNYIKQRIFNIFRKH